MCSLLSLTLPCVLSAILTLSHVCSLLSSLCHACGSCCVFTLSYVFLPCLTVIAVLCVIPAVSSSYALIGFNSISCSVLSFFLISFFSCVSFHWEECVLAPQLFIAIQLGRDGPVGYGWLPWLPTCIISPVDRPVVSSSVLQHFGPDQGI